MESLNRLFFSVENVEYVVHTYQPEDSTDRFCHAEQFEVARSSVIFLWHDRSTPQPELSYEN